MSMRQLNWTIQFHALSLPWKRLSEKDKVELTEKIDKEMIGGFILNVGDRQIDASMKNKLQALKVKFSHNPYIKEF
jgi:F-type H+-transporting ATPase subunit delta